MSQFRHYLLYSSNPKYLRGAKLAHVALSRIQGSDFLLDPVESFSRYGQRTKKIESGHCSLSTLSFFVKKMIYGTKAIIYTLLVEESVFQKSLKMFSNTKTILSRIHFNFFLFLNDFINKENSKVRVVLNYEQNNNII